MNPKQHQITMHPAELEPFNLSDFLDELFGGAPVVVHPTEDPFAKGWNLAMQHIRDNPPAPALLPLPVNVIFNDPATIVFWNDGTKTVVKCQPGDVFNAETGLTTAMLKKYMGNDNTFNRVINDWLKRTGNYHRFALPAPTETPALPGVIETVTLPEATETV